MNRQEYLNHIGAIDNVRKSVAAKKSTDYATEDNALRDGQQMQQMCAALDIDVRRSAEDVYMFFTLHKLQRYANLMGGREPENESVYDTLVDGHNYFDLTYLCRQEALQHTPTSNDPIQETDVQRFERLRDNPK